MNNPVITFIVPAYNSAATLRYCLDSLPSTPDVEVLIVNDGSTDETATIAAEYPQFTLINKENGGHGSVINYASSIALGRYMKVIDSDDKVRQENLHKYIETLREATADVVFTHFRTINMENGATREYKMKNISFGKEMTFEYFWQHKKDVQAVCYFHGITFNTKFYKRCGIQLSEKISYEDQEYATLPFAHVRSVHTLNIFLYEYSLGVPGQSMSPEKQAKNLHMMETVLNKVQENTPDHEPVRSYFRYKIKRMLLSYYMAAMLHSVDKRMGRKLAWDMHKRKPLAWKYYFICFILSFIRKSPTQSLDNHPQRQRSHVHENRKA